MPAHQKHAKHPSAMVFVLKGLIPYTRENLLLSFNPSRFFRELEKTSHYSGQTLKHAYWRAKHGGYISGSDIPRLTERGLSFVKPYTAKKLAKHSKLMVIFDVPEDLSAARRRFREVLREWQFEQVQKSVWTSNLDYKDLLEDLVDELGLNEHVEIYESHRLYPKSV